MSLVSAAPSDLSLNLDNTPAVQCTGNDGYPTPAVYITMQINDNRYDIQPGENLCNLSSIRSLLENYDTASIQFHCTKVNRIGNSSGTMTVGLSNINCNLNVKKSETITTQMPTKITGTLIVTKLETRHDEQNACRLNFCLKLTEISIKSNYRTCYCHQVTSYIVMQLNTFLLRKQYFNTTEKKLL